MESRSFKSRACDKSRSFCPGHPNNKKITTWFGDTEVLEGPNFLHFFLKTKITKLFLKLI